MVENRYQYVLFPLLAAIAFVILLLSLYPRPLSELKSYRFITPALSPKPSPYVCPDKEWVDCMPIVDQARSFQCSQGYLQWAKKNCPNFKGAAL